MKVTKEEKALYKFLNTLTTILKNDGGEDVIFTRDGNIYFCTWFIAGYVDIKQNDKKVYDFMGEKTYSILKDIKQNYILEEINEISLSEDKQKLIRGLRARAYASVSKGKYLCRIETAETHRIAKISHVTNKYLKDSYLGLMKNLKEFDVFENEEFITLENEEYIAKENTKVIKVFALFCDKKLEDDFNQVKMEV